MNHGLAAKLATDLLLLRSLDRLFSYRKFIASLSLSGIRTLSLFFSMMISCFATLLNVIEAFFIVDFDKLNFVPLK